MHAVKSILAHTFFGYILFAHAYVSLRPKYYVSRGFHRQELSSLELTAESLNDMLEEIVFSGDIEGFIRRRSKEVMQDEFIQFLSSKMETCDDDDEKKTVAVVLDLINRKIRATDGLGDSTVTVFERRLDRLLFTNPNQRVNWITENKVEMTPGFLDYIKSEIKKTSDQDSKVVLASILQLVGQVLNEDVLGSEASLLTFESGAETYIAKVASSGMSAAALMDRNEQILAGLMFSENDPVEDTLNNVQYLDDDFISFLQKRVENSADMEERVGLKSLLETVTAVLDKVRDAQGTEIDVRDTELTIDQVKQRMAEMQLGQEGDGKGKATTPSYAAEFTVQSEARDTFLSILSRFQNLPEDVTVATVVDANYELCDKQFMDFLSEEIADCLSQGADTEAQQYQEIKAAITKAMATRINLAQSKVAQVLAKAQGRPGEAGLRAMEAEIVALVRRKEIDEAVVLLMEANQQQALEAGATAVADVFRQLLKRVRSEQEKSLPDEQKLLRQLMRTTSSDERKGLLYAAFKPSKTPSDDGGFVDGPPLVTPPAFINIVRNVMTGFGNVDSVDIMGKMQNIISEAQAVATELYGEGMTPRQQQKFMFEKKTLSVWDLAKFEEEATLTGGDVPWRNDAYDGKGPEEVLGDRIRRIGGSDDPLV